MASVFKSTFVLERVPPHVVPVAAAKAPWSNSKHHTTTMDRWFLAEWGHPATANSTFLTAIFSNPLTATETAAPFLRPCLLRRIRLNGKSCCVSFPAAAVAGQSEPSFGGAGEPVEPNARQVGEGCGSAGASPSRGGVPYRADRGRRLGRSLALPMGCALPGGWRHATRQEPRPPEGVCPTGRMGAGGSAGASPSRGRLKVLWSVRA